MKIITSPDRIHLDRLAFWLEAEQKNTGHGFFCNWDVILEAHKKKNLYVIECNSETLGLLVWHEWRSNGTISILSIHPKHRKLGMGKRLVEFYLNAAKNRGVKNVKLQCQPCSSEPFWLALRFSENENQLCPRIKGIPMEKLNLCLTL